MKKFYALFAAAAMLTVAFSCTKTEEPGKDPNPGKDPEPEVTTITEITATLEGAGIKTAWAAGDAVIVYAVTDSGDLSAKYVLASGEGTTSATFKAEGTGLASDAAAYYASYPYSSIDFAQHNTFAYSLEAEQTVANPIFGSTTDGKAYKFSSPLAGLEIKLTGKGNAARLYLEDANTNSILNGNVEYNAATGKMKIKNSSSSKNTVAKSFDAVTLSDAASSFLMEVPAGTLATGASLTVYNPANGMIGIVEIPAQELVAGKLTTVGPIALKEVSSVADLSALESANCYMITEPGEYKFKTVKGNEPSSVGTVATAEIIWETYNNNAEVAANSVIASVSYANDYITFKTPETLVRGNALIAAKDAAGTILWSWHIWVVADMVISGTTFGFEGETAELMNYNLGALGEPGTVEALGMLYEWGRKDPFLSVGDLGGESRASVAGVAMTTTEEQGTVSEEWAIANPTVFVLVAGSDGFKDWCETHDNTRWAAEKAIYDPCPAGWRVPAVEDHAFFSNDTLVKSEDGNVLTVNKEYTFPYTWCLNYNNGSLSKDSKYFTCNASGDDYGYAYRVNSSASQIRRKAEGCSIRCLKVAAVEE